MGITNVKGGDGQLLWQANDFGAYSVQKTDAIVKVLQEIFKTTRIKMNIIVDDTSNDVEVVWQDSDSSAFGEMQVTEIARILQALLSNLTLKVKANINDGHFLDDFYTKDECDNRFLKISVFPSKVDNIINQKIASGEIFGEDSYNYLVGKLSPLYQSCYGTDLEGHPIEVGFNVRIQDLEDVSDFIYNRVVRISRDIYYVDESHIDINTLVVAKLEETGRKADLSSDISDRSTIVAAVNSVNSSLTSTSTSLGNRVSDLETKCGNETLTTTAQTLSGAVNELNTGISSISGYGSRISNLENKCGSATLLTTDKTLSGAINELKNTIGTTGGSKTLTTRVSDLETKCGNATLDTTSQTLSGAINELKGSIGTVSTSLGTLSTNVGNVSSLDNGFTTKQVVAALNQLLGSISSINSSLGSLDTRVQTLENRPVNISLSLDEETETVTITGS